MAAGAFAAVLAFSIGARAESEPVTDEDVWTKPFAVMADLGLGTPTGYYGLSFEWAPDPLFVASVGAGIGRGPYCLSPDDQPPSYDSICSHWYKDVQLAAAGRFRVLRVEQSALAFGAGVSMGGYTWVEFTTDEPAYKSTERAYWANLDVSYEYRAHGGFTARAFVGYGFLMNPGDLTCVSWGAGSGSASHCEADHGGDGQRLFYLGGAAGYAF